MRHDQIVRYEVVAVDVRRLIHVLARVEQCFRTDEGEDTTARRKKGRDDDTFVREVARIMEYQRQWELMRGDRLVQPGAGVAV